MRAIWHLAMTEEGARVSPGWEVNSALVVIAASPREARQAASLAAIDEGPGIWLSPALSKCSKIGPCTNNRVANGVLVADNNAS